MVGEWRDVTIEEIAAHVAMGPFGSSIKVETFVADGIPVISGQHLQGQRLNDEVGYNFVSEEHASRLARANVHRGDVIFTHAGNIGQVAYIPADSRYERYVISQRQFYLRPNRDVVCPEFLVAFFKTPEGRHKLLANASQVGVPSIARPVSYLRTIELSLPPLSEQLAIAHILGKLDDKIELNRRLGATLEAMARAVFKAWFVDFEPVRAKAEGRDPGLPAHLAALFPDRLVETEYGEVPEGWRTAPVSDFAQLKGGKQLEKQRFVQDGSVPVFGGAGLMGHTDQHNAEGYVISVGRVGAYCGQFFAHRGRAWINNNASLISQFDGVPGEWLLLSLRHLDMDLIKKGAAQPFVSNSDLAAMPIVAPTPQVLKAFHRIIEPLFRREEFVRSEIESLAAVRDALLPQLVSGDLRVEDAETFLDRVL